MKKTYITTMPNHIGAFLKASRCFSALGVNITRVSYNKAVDSHTLFIDAEGSEEQLERADRELEKIGYLQNPRSDAGIVLLEFRLRDVPGSVTDVLDLISRFDFNISYISSQENGSEYQYFKMGLYVDDSEKIERFLQSAGEICSVRVIDYNHAERIYDNSIFYNSFVSGICKELPMNAEQRDRLLVNANLAMQTLDEQGLSPYRTFDSIGRFAHLLAQHTGAAFSPRVTRHALTEQCELLLIEPPCGSNTAVLRCGDELLFIDTGYACYRAEMEALLNELIPDFSRLRRTALITHADVDHCGLLPMFDRILASRKSADCLIAEYNGGDGFREKNALHKPYINICKLLTDYAPPSPDALQVPWQDVDVHGKCLQQIGFFDFGDLHFEVYEGEGGHLAGEILLIDYVHHVAFTGDVYLNLRGMTAAQAEYNRYAPILMTSVDTNPDLCAAERQAFLSRLGVGRWLIFGAHGAVKEYGVGVEK